jgi:hypothetical protein
MAKAILSGSSRAAFNYGNAAKAVGFRRLRPLTNPVDFRRGFVLEVGSDSDGFFVFTTGEYAAGLLDIGGSLC